MTEKQVQNVVAQAIAETTLRREKYYHVCWWEDRFQCLHARHAKDVHDVFYGAPGQVFIEGLSAYQWKLLTERIADFCGRHRIALDTCAGAMNSEHGVGASRGTTQVTEFDSTRLRAVLEGARATGSARDSYLHRLQRLLDTADTVPPREVPGNVVTMNSKVRLRDKHDAEMTVSLVFPEDAARDGDPETRKVSVLTPMGLAILGRRVGHLIAHRIRIDGLVYQPEGAGDFNV